MSSLGWSCVPVLAMLAMATATASAAPEPTFTPLRSAREPVLQAALEALIDQRGLRPLVRKRKLAVTLVGITDPSCPRMAGVNGNAMMYAASMPKLAILLGAFKRIERGELVLDPELEGLMTRMIRDSSNPAATEVMDRVGREFIAEVLQSKEYRLYDPEFGGGLWVGRAYAKRPAWRRDPLHNLSHGATTLQVARLYYHSDSAIIERGGRRYIVVAMVEDPRGGEILEKLVLGLDSLIFEVPTHCPGATEIDGSP